MRLVVLDGYTLNPGDLSWQPLESLCECTIHEHTPPDLLLARADGAEIVLTNKTDLTREIIERLPALRYIGVMATGYNVVDISAARERGIVLTNIPAYGTSSVAQMTMAHVLNLAQHAAYHAQTVADGHWAGSRDFCYWDYPLVELDGLVMGIVGLGRIGRTVAELARAFGMRVQGSEAAPGSDLPEWIELVGMDELFAASDVISLHCPQTPETQRLVNAARLGMMKPTAFLVNTSRGALVDEAALAAALNAGRIAGAGLDVLTIEPPDVDNPLVRAKNCYVTPHIAWATRAARQRLLDTAVENVRAFLGGRPQNVVGGQAGK